MKRIFTSFLLIAVAFISSIVFAADFVYAIPQGWRNDRANASERLVYSIMLNGATKDAQEAPFFVKLNDRGGSQPKVFVDMTSHTADISANDEIKVTLDHGIEWMHSYLYIDYNHDGVFDMDTELVSYSFYSPTGSSWGENSAGGRVQNGNKTLDLPKFTVPANVQTVTTRMRLKIDWNSKETGGSEEQGNSIGGNRGSFFILQLIFMVMR